jgi:hypothetical protein
MILISSGTVAGTGSPEIRITAPNRAGHTSKQVPQLLHFV